MNLNCFYITSIASDAEPVLAHDLRCGISDCPVLEAEADDDSATG